MINQGIDLKILKALFNITNSIGSELELEKVCDLDGREDISGGKLQWLCHYPYK